MSLYLIHVPLIFWIKFIIHGPAEWLDGKNEFTMPNWAIPIHLLVSLAFGTLLTLFVEDPARKFLTKCLVKQKEKDQTLTLEK